MPAPRAFARILHILRAAACSSLLVAGSASAGLADIRLEVSSDGKKVDFEVRDAPRREVLKQLFYGSPVEIKWINAAFAEQRIGGKFSGTPALVVRQLLAGTNFVVVHQDEGDVSRVVQLVIVGPATGELSSAGLAALAAAIKPNAVGFGLTPPETSKAPLTPQFTEVDLTAPTAPKSLPAAAPPLAARNSLLSAPERNGDATGVLVPPPEGAIAPRLVLKEGAGTPPLSPPPSQKGKDLPLMPPGPGPQDSVRRIAN
jgi:hypothetical protein